MTPIDIAIQAMILMKRSISWTIGAVPAEAVEAKLAIYPITVLSPVLKTIPVPEPLVQAVPKKLTLGLSKIFLARSSGILRSSSDSPVSDALLTFISLLLIMITSAGMLSPRLMSTISPGTRSLADMIFLTPFLQTVALGGMKSLNYAMIAADF
jgi:hypothetical protein